MLPPAVLSFLRKAGAPSAAGRRVQPLATPSAPRSLSAPFDRRARHQAALGAQERHAAAHGTADSVLGSGVVSPDHRGERPLSHRTMAAWPVAMRYGAGCESSRSRWPHAGASTRYAPGRVSASAKSSFMRPTKGIARLRIGLVQVGFLAPTRLRPFSTTWCIACRPRRIGA